MGKYWWLLAWWCHRYYPFAWVSVHCVCCAVKFSQFQLFVDKLSNCTRRVEFILDGAWFNIY